MLEGKGKIWRAASLSTGHVVYIPSCITTDSTYPFKWKESVKVILDPKKKTLTIRKS